MTLLPTKFGPYGGQYVPETLMPALIELEQAFVEAWHDAKFRAEYDRRMASYVGRPTPLTSARRLTEQLGGAQIYLKREDLAHTGAHKINNALGQGLLAQRMGKRRIVAETGAGQHGVASATVAALLGLECVVYMGAVDMRRQEPNVDRMRLLGAEVRAVTSGTQTLKDAINEAIRDWVTNVHDTHYLLGSALGPHPYPTMVREFQSVIGREAREQMLAETGRLPDSVIACVGGGSNAIGIFSGFMEDAVELIGVEAGGNGIGSGKHAARFGDPKRGRVGVIHGTRTFVLQDEDGQIAETHSISAGLDYAAVGPEHALLRDMERACYTSATDDEALDAFSVLCKTEGIIPALESSHALAEVIKRAPKMRKDQAVLVNLSGRGDKDLNTVTKLLGINDRDGDRRARDRMSRLEDAFRNKPIFMPYYPLGYPDLKTSIEVIEALSKNGADLMEIGLSFSDPLADGPVIQKATQIALENGITVRKSLQAVAELRRRGVQIPLVLMGYYNPMLAYGLERFVNEARSAEADGFIIPDLPMEEAAEFEAIANDLPLIRMLAPTTPDERMETIARQAKGFLYLVSVTGTTGARASVADGLGQLVARVRAHTAVPICVGFGISTPEQAKAVSMIADGVIVGSACVQAIGESRDPIAAAAEFGGRFREGLRMGA